MRHEATHNKTIVNVQELITNVSEDELGVRIQCAWQKNVVKALCILLLIGLILCLPDVLKLFGIENENIASFTKFIDKHNILTNVIGTLVGLLISFWVLRPRLYISELQQYKDSQDNVYLALRFENIGIWDVYDVHVELQSFMFNDHNERETFSIQLTKADVPILKNMLAKKTNKSYVVVSQSKISEIPLIEPCEGIRCRVSATHAFSGLRYVSEKEYTKQK